MFQEATQASAWGSKETDTGQNIGDTRVMESSMLKSVIICKKNGSDLRIKDGFDSYMKEDSKSLAQAGMLTELRMLTTSRY